MPKISLASWLSLPVFVFSASRFCAYHGWNAAAVTSLPEMPLHVRGFKTGSSAYGSHFFEAYGGPPGVRDNDGNVGISANHA